MAELKKIVKWLYPHDLGAERQIFRVLDCNYIVNKWGKEELTLILQGTHNIYMWVPRLDNHNKIVDKFKTTESFINQIITLHVENDTSGKEIFVLTI